MALNANCVANVTTSGSDDNAGWFDTTSGDTAGGVNDRAFSNSPIIIDGVTITASVHSTTTQANIVGHTLATTDRGNVLRITGGTATAGYYRITSVDTANNRVTVDASMGAASATITGRIGGAFASPGFAYGSAPNSIIGHQIHIKTGTYLIGSGTAGTSGNGLAAASGGSRPSVSGYTNTYNDGGKPTLKANASNVVIITTSSNDAYATIKDLILDGDGQTNSIGLDSSAGTLCVYNVNATKFTNNAFRGAGTFIACSATLCSTQPAFSSVNAIDCIATNNTVTGFGGYGLARSLSGCISAFNSGASSDGFQFQDARLNYVRGCIAYGNGRYGYYVLGYRQISFQDCVAYANVNNGFFLNSTGWAVSLRQVASDTFSSIHPTTLVQVSNTTLTANPFIDPVNGNFALNSTSGGGATLRALNFQLPSISTTRYPFGGWYAPGGGCPLIGPGGLVY
jgi:hypothetical protein